MSVTKLNLCELNTMKASEFSTLGGVFQNPMVYRALTCWCALSMCCTLASTLYGEMITKIIQ